MAHEFDAVPRHTPFYIALIAVVILLYNAGLLTYFIYFSDPAYPIDLFKQSPNKGFWITLYNPLFRFVGHYGAMVYGISSTFAVLLIYITILTRKQAVLTVVYFTANASVLSVLLESQLVGFLGLGNQGFLITNAVGQQVNYYNWVGWNLTHLDGGFLPLWFYWLPFVALNYWIIEWTYQAIQYGEFTYYRTWFCRSTECPTVVLQLVGDAQKKTLVFVNRLHLQKLASPAIEQSLQSATTQPIEPPKEVAPIIPTVAQLDEVAAQTAAVRQRFKQKKQVSPEKPVDANNPLKICIGEQAGAPFTITLGHTSIGGTTGAGKTRFIWDILTQLILHDPHRMQLALVCAKQFKTFEMFAHLPHIKLKVTQNDPVQFQKLVKFIIDEHSRRFALFKDYIAANIEEYNEYCDKSEQLPYFIVIIDEMGFMIKSLPQDLLDSFFDQMQIIREAGIFVILGSQVPSAKTFPPEAMGNMQFRIALRCVDHYKSVSAIGYAGAEKLDIEDRETLLVSGSVASGAPVQFKRREVTDKILWQRIATAEKGFGFDEKVKAEIVAALKRRKVSASIPNTAIPLNNLNIPTDENERNNGIFLPNGINQPQNNSVSVAQNVVPIETAIDIDLLFELLATDVPQEQIAERLGVAQSTVSKKKSAMLSRVSQLIKRGNKIEEIAEVMHCQKKTVVRIYKFLGKSHEEIESLPTVPAVAV